MLQFSMSTYISKTRYLLLHELYFGFITRCIIYVLFYIYIYIYIKYIYIIYIHIYTHTYIYIKIIYIGGHELEVFPRGVSSKLENSKAHKFTRNMFFFRNVLKLYTEILMSSFERIFVFLQQNSF